MKCNSTILELLYVQYKSIGAFIQNSLKKIKDLTLKIFYQPYEFIRSFFLSPNYLLHYSEKFFDKEAPKMIAHNHLHHNLNPYLFKIGYGPILLDPKLFKMTNALDFGSGGGRNAINLSQLADFNLISLSDISAKNLELSKNNLKDITSCKFDFIKSNGMNINSDLRYRFIFSTICFQHIPSRIIRNSLFADLIRLLDDNGVMSFQMGYGKSRKLLSRKFMVGYNRNQHSAKVTNGKRDVRVTNPNEVIEDLKKAGAGYIEYFITPAFADKHPYWIWFHVYKTN